MYIKNNRKSTTDIFGGKMICYIIVQVVAVIKVTKGHTGNTNENKKAKSKIFLLTKQKTDLPINS